MQRREFLRIMAAGTADASLGGVALGAPGSAHPRDLALDEEARHPLLAGQFDEALRVLVPRSAASRDSRIPYTIAVIHFLQGRYHLGVEFAVTACHRAPNDLRCRWLLRTLVLSGGGAEADVLPPYRLHSPPSVPSTVRMRDATDAAGVGRWALGRGVAWGDFDNDGRDDILVAAERAPFRLLRNRGDGTFTDVAEALGLTDPIGLGAYGAQFVDYDNDGFQDVFLTGSGWGGVNRLFLFHNERGRRFRDVTAAAGLGEPINAFGCAWADYDNDGNADLVVAAGIVDPPGGDRLRLYHNDGNGRFRELGEQAGLRLRARWIAVCWGDYDGDGRPDLLATSLDQGCHLFRNLGGGRFADVSHAAGVSAAIPTYTAEFFDYDNDGRLDLFVSTYPPGDLSAMIAHQLGAPLPDNQRQLLFRNQGDGTFRDVSAAAGITGWHGAMSSQIADLNNDGFAEIVLGTGNPELDWTEPKALFENDGRGGFKETAASAGLLQFGMLHGIACADYDDSGYLSLFGSFGGFYWGTRELSRLYRNTGRGHRALEIKLIGRHCNRDAIGARLQLRAGTQRLFRWVDGGNGFGSLNSRVVHFGLGTRDHADALAVIWPCGRQQTFRGLAAGQRIEIVEGEAGWRPLAKLRTGSG